MIQQKKHQAGDVYPGRFSQVFYGIQADPRFLKMEVWSHSSHSGNNLDTLPLATQILCCGRGCVS